MATITTPAGSITLDALNAFHILALVPLVKGGGGFTLSVEDADLNWTTLWLHPAVPIAVTYDRTELPTRFDVDVLGDLAEHAAQPMGLSFPAEPGNSMLIRD